MKFSAKVLALQLIACIPALAAEDDWIGHEMTAQSDIPGLKVTAIGQGPTRSMLEISLNRGERIQLLGLSYSQMPIATEVLRGIGYRSRSALTFTAAPKSSGPHERVYDWNALSISAGTGHASLAQLVAEYEAQPSRGCELAFRKYFGSYSVGALPPELGNRLAIVREALDGIRDYKIESVPDGTHPLEGKPNGLGGKTLQQHVLEIAEYTAALISDTEEWIRRGKISYEQGIAVMRALDITVEPSNQPRYVVANDAGEPISAPCEFFSTGSNERLTFSAGDWLLVNASRGEPTCRGTVKPMALIPPRL